jgi:hypothetical protein
MLPTERLRRLRVLVLGVLLPVGTGVLAVRPGVLLLPVLPGLRLTEGARVLPIRRLTLRVRLRLVLAPSEGGLAWLLGRVFTPARLWTRLAIVRALRLLGMLRLLRLLRRGLLRRRSLLWLVEDHCRLSLLRRGLPLRRT